ncbi:HAD family hydrolase [Congregibacter variabilis]|uniref:HAD family hydrolase n=1 Tax=Congregibacter variabilis TaxID=3081200 RepID=A0ABZ0I7R3_9GAMM|nr:HAD family hydrolase [Congregibacter sp. IMCC43200]
MTVRRVAMWSGPRNISTAMMRSFENRSDCAVIDEPFYAAYLAATGHDHPGRSQVLSSQSQDWRTVADALCTEEPAPVYYQKHMTQHILPDMDLAFTEQFTNCFLVREPRRIIASYARVREDFSLDELGFAQQAALFERECDRLGAVPPVLDAALTLSNPRDVLRQLCSRLSIAFDEGMLSWPAGPRESDGVWGPHWYASVWASTGFAAPVQGQKEEAVVLSAAQEALCTEAQRSYEIMLTHALRG